MSPNKHFSKSLVPLIVVCLLAMLGFGIALAGQNDGNAEEGFDPAGDKTETLNPEETSSSQTGQDSPNFLQNAEGFPDSTQSLFNDEEQELIPPEDSQMAQFFLRSAGSNFVPRDSATTYSYYGGGCMQRDSNTGDSWFTLDIQVPEGAIIDFLRVYFYDNNGTYDINSELWAFDAAGGTSLIAEADSTGSPGYSSAGSDFFSHTVDNINESLVVVASIQGGVSNGLALCGVRLRYQYNPFSANFLPAVLNQPVS